MKNVFWLIVGIGVGFIGAHFVARNPSGKRLLDEINAKAVEFTSAIVDGYKDREAELHSVTPDGGAASH